MLLCAHYCYELTCDHYCCELTRAHCCCALTRDQCCCELTCAQSWCVLTSHQGWLLPQPLLGVQTAVFSCVLTWPSSVCVSSSLPLRTTAYRVRAQRPHFTRHLLSALPPAPPRAEVPVTARGQSAHSSDPARHPPETAPCPLALTWVTLQRR